MSTVVVAAMLARESPVASCAGSLSRLSLTYVGAGGRDSGLGGLVAAAVAGINGLVAAGNGNAAQPAPAPISVPARLPPVPAGQPNLAGSGGAALAWTELRTPSGTGM